MKKYLLAGLLLVIGAFAFALDDRNVCTQDNCYANGNPKWKMAYPMPADEFSKLQSGTLKGLVVVEIGRIRCNNCAILMRDLESSGALKYLSDNGVKFFQVDAFNPVNEPFCSVYAEGKTPVLLIFKDSQLIIKKIGYSDSRDRNKEAIFQDLRQVIAPYLQ